MSQVEPEPALSPPAPVPAPAAPEPPADLARRRWLTAALATLLVALYLVTWVTYARLHLPPLHYEQQPPGAVASKVGADFTLVGLTRTPVLAGLYDSTQPAASGAVWVVARLQVTRRSQEEFFNCAVVLVGVGGRTWEPETPPVSRATKSCLEDETPLGASTPIEVIFQIPLVDADRIAGVAVPQNTGGRDPVLTLPS